MKIKKKSVFHERTLSVTTENPKSYLLSILRVPVNGDTPGRYVSIEIGDDDARQVVEALGGTMPTPPPPTFAEQFAQLDIGDRFTVEWPSPFYGSTKDALKLDEERYFSYTTGSVLPLKHVGTDGIATLTKIEKEN